jgi:hypothetical protein
MASEAEGRVRRAVADKLDSGTRWLLRRGVEHLPRLLPACEELRSV